MNRVQVRNTPPGGLVGAVLHGREAVWSSPPPAPIGPPGIEEVIPRVGLYVLRCCWRFKSDGSPSRSKCLPGGTRRAPRRKFRTSGLTRTRGSIARAGDSDTRLTRTRGPSPAPQPAGGAGGKGVPANYNTRTPRPSLRRHAKACAGRITPFDAACCSRRCSADSREPPLQVRRSASPCYSESHAMEDVAAPGLRQAGLAHRQTTGRAARRAVGRAKRRINRWTCGPVD